MTCSSLFTGAPAETLIAADRQRGGEA